MTLPKPFQAATVEAVLHAFRSKRRHRRFLVADEVGLGKTVVAQQVMKTMMQRRRTPLVVMYMCSNLSIAAQNRRKLLEILPPEERESAVSHVDRLSLLTADDGPDHERLRIYSLTPDTSIPMRRGRRRDGRQEERALIHALMERCYPVFFEEWKKKTFRRNAGDWWMHHVREQRDRAASRSLQDAFRASVRKEFDLDAGMHLLPAIRELEDLELIGHLRNALAASAVERLSPDLVIFDEFQRFRDLLAPPRNSPAERVINRLRGDGGPDAPALLLLSATPYRLYSRRTEERTGAAPRDEFFELVEFLYGNTIQATQKRSECEEAFAILEEELHKGAPRSDRAQSAKQNAERLLRDVMARTERASHHDGANDGPTRECRAPLHGQDLSVFKHMTESFQEQHRSAAVPYWTSVPLPMQSLGPHYVAWKAATDVEAAGAPELTEVQRDRHEALAPWPHPRLRALQDFMPADQLISPWLAPSKPWWPLVGRWKSEEKAPKKALLFSRFRAAPQVVAASVSFDLESHFLRGGGVAYPEVSKRRLLTASDSRHALLALFCPWPALIRGTDPLAMSKSSLAGVRRDLRKQIARLLAQRGIRVDAGAPKAPLWNILAQLEDSEDSWPRVLDAWHANLRSADPVDGEGGLRSLLDEWDEVAGEVLARVHPDTVTALVEHALSAPGVVVGRALFRHWPELLDDDNLDFALGASWNGLRNYLDQRWFFSAFRRGKEKYPSVISRLVVEGNLESVLDEHLWITARLRNQTGKELAEELEKGLSLRNGLFYLHELGAKEAETFSLRCHVAMPFVEARAAYGQERAGKSKKHGRGEKEERIRTDDLRRSFNSPFWPHVLATTSVGQEGLDFHAWCDRIVHWDLCRNPVDLEQREGRIQRFGGLSARKAVAGVIGAELHTERAEGESPWAAIERLAERSLADDSGLAPWWVCPGAEVERLVFDVPTSEQRQWLAWVQEQRLLYRLALGQPNQEDLVELLVRRGDLGKADVHEIAINLSPFFGPKEG